MIVERLTKEEYLVFGARLCCGIDDPRRPWWVAANLGEHEVTSLERLSSFPFHITSFAPPIRTISSGSFSSGRRSVKQNKINGPVKIEMSCLDSSKEREALNMFTGNEAAKVG